MVRFLFFHHVYFSNLRTDVSHFVNYTCEEADVCLICFLFSWDFHHLTPVHLGFLKILLGCMLFKNDR